MSFHDLKVTILAVLCSIGFLVVRTRVHVLETRVVELERQVHDLEKLGSMVVYHDVLLDAHAEMLVDYYKERMLRRGNWASGRYWAARVAAGSDR